MHKNTDVYSLSDFETLGQAISLFSNIVVLPGILAEVSSLARQVRNPARDAIQLALKTIVEACGEVHIPAMYGVQRSEYLRFGLTDALILELCASNLVEAGFWLLTHDGKLAVQAETLGLDVLNFAHFR